MTEKPKRMDEKELRKRVRDLYGWTVKDCRLKREFVFKDFAEAWSFMTRIALLAERQNHHPTWSNAWNRVKIELYTHSLDCISSADVRLARAINSITQAETGGIPDSIELPPVSR